MLFITVDIFYLCMCMKSFKYVFFYILTQHMFENLNKYPGYEILHIWTESKNRWFWGKMKSFIKKKFREDITAAVKAQIGGAVKSDEMKYIIKFERMNKQIYIIITCPNSRRE